MSLEVRSTTFVGNTNAAIDGRLDTVLARFDKYIGPILLQVFSKVIHLDVMKDWNRNVTIPRRFLSRDQSVCSRLFAANTSFNQQSLKHSFPDLYK
jgi:hypothetical protein